MKKRLALSLNQDQSKSLEKIKTMALITGFYEAKSVNEELKRLDSFLLVTTNIALVLTEYLLLFTKVISFLDAMSALINESIFIFWYVLSDLISHMFKISVIQISKLEW